MRGSSELECQGTGLGPWLRSSGSSPFHLLDPPSPHCEMQGVGRIATQIQGVLEQYGSKRGTRIKVRKPTVKQGGQDRRKAGCCYQKLKDWVGLIR